MKSASHPGIFLMATTFVVIAIVTGVIVIRGSDKLQERHETVFKPRAQAYNIQPDMQAVNLTLPESSVSADEYKDSIKNLLVSYNNKTLNYYDAESAYKYSGDQLLNMKVPDGYQQFHLDLVLRFEDLSTAVSLVIADKPAALSDLEEARENMDLFLTQHTWIK